MPDDKEIELTNTAKAPRTVPGPDGKQQTILPGETKKVKVTEDMAKRLGEWSEGGSPLVLGKPKEASSKGETKGESAKK